MRFTVPKTALSEALTWVTRSLPTRPPVPVLAGVRITVRDGVARLSTYDYEHSAAYALDVAAEQDGDTLVSGRLLNDIVRSLPNRDVTLAVDGKSMHVQAGASKFKVQVMPLDEYPTLPALPPQIGTVDGSAFADAARRVSIAADKGDTLPILTAVKMDIDAEQRTITLTATDRYRLSKRVIEFTPAPGAVSATVLIPARALDGYSKALNSATEVTLMAGGDAATFGVSAGIRQGTTRLLDGEYPKVDTIFPAAFAFDAVVDTAELSEAVKRVGLVAEKNTPCRLVFEGDALTIAAGRDDDQSASEQIAIAEYTGEDITIAFNFGYLTDGLGTIGDEQVRFLMAAETRPAVLRPASDTDATSSYLIMPVRVPGR